jgi:hypothetical protein
VHSSWFVRALQVESPAVRLAVAAHAAESIRPVLRAGLKIGESDLRPDHAPHPLALRWALSLWTERLVGGATFRVDDPAPIRVLAPLPAGERDKALSLVGCVKIAYAASAPGPSAFSVDALALSPVERGRVEVFSHQLTEPNSNLVHLARLDVNACEHVRPLAARIGLVTVGRLLTLAQAHRVRWFLQHLPYEDAKFTRSRMDLVASPLASKRDIVGWESQNFRLACEHLGAAGPSGDELGGSQ